jgi:hypothetical protein
MYRLISAIDQITPTWLTQVLQKNGHLPQGEVIDVRPAVTGATSTGGPGFRPGHRLEVRYSAAAHPRAPTGLYVKLNDGRGDTLAGKREASFYISIAADMPDPPSVPCYDAVTNSETGAYHLLLKDVSETHVLVEREAPAPRADAERMIDLLAAFHAHWWDHPRLGQESERVDAWFIQGEEELDFPGFVDYLGDRLSAQRREIYERVLAALPRMLGQRLAAGPLTLVHDDAHFWNFLLPRDPQQERVYLVDWQQWGISAGPHDVAYMMALFWYPERRARLEQDLVRRYHDRLLAHGIQGYDWEACWNDYRLFAMRNLMVPLWAWRWSHWGFHRWMQLEKAILAFQDLNCAELLEH